jgi:glyoxylase-like metal-dependent hydrolase (beta-lactamase superfamily II)
MPVKQVAENVFVNLGNSDSVYDGWGANQTFIITYAGVILIDTGFTSRISNSLLKEIKKRTNKHVRLVINTHDHSDHVFGNSVFAKATILAHNHCRARIIERGQERIKAYRRLDRKLKEDLDGISIVPPQRTYEEGFAENFGGTTLKIMHPAKGAHTKGDTMVLLPEDKILISGDVLSVNYHPNLEDADLPAWLSTLEAIKEMRVDQIVPGHGPVSSKEYLGIFESYLKSFDKEVRKQAKKGAKDIPMIEGSEDWKLKMIVERNFRLLYNKYSGAEQFYDAIPR